MHSYSVEDYQSSSSDSSSGARDFRSEEESLDVSKEKSQEEEK